MVLKPEWVNGYISQVLDSAEVDSAHGLLTRAEMTRLWAGLDRGMRDHFLGMMDKYEISFRVFDESGGVVSLVVERLPWNAPSYEDIWNDARDASGTSEIRVRYQLNTTPPGIPTWFIARSHRFTMNVHWRNGAVLRRVTGTRLTLRLYCEEPGAWHPLPDDAGCYEVNESADWLQKIKPHLTALLTILKHAAPLAGPVLGMTVAHVSDQLKAEIETMTELVGQIPEPSRALDSLDKDEGRRDPGPADRASGDADFRALEALLLKLDPNREWGGLSRTVTPEGLTLYLCHEHSDAYRRTVRL